MAPGSPLRRRLRETAVAAGARVLSTSTARQRLWTEMVLREASPSAALLEDRMMQFMALCAAMGRRSHAQLFQDVWAWFERDMEYGGSFVEFGATDGRTISNTWMLERCFGWRGVLAEPNPTWHGSLKANRPGAIIDTRCVWQSSGSTLEFTQTLDPELAGVTRSRREVLGNDAAIDHGSRIITVETVSLNDLLRQHGVPHDFDFLSVDTEGSESVILAALDFDVYRPGASPWSTVAVTSTPSWRSWRVATTGECSRNFPSTTPGSSTHQHEPITMF